MSKRTRPTSRDIARLAEVSQATVSRALRNSSLVKPETRARVASIARRLKYTADRTASGLRSRRSQTLALLLFEEDQEEAQINPFFLAMLGHIAREVARRGLDLLVSFQQLSEDWHADYLTNNRADGIILLGYGDYLASMPRLTELAAEETSFVIFGPPFAGMAGRYVGCDNEAGGAQATRHLLELGRRRIAFVGGATDHWPEFQARYRGHVQALRDAGIEAEPALQVGAVSGEEAGFQAARALLDSGQSFDALFAASDAIACGAIRALYERGRSVPGDVAVVGFDDIPAAAHFHPPLTTVRQDTRRSAQMLVENLMRRINGDPVEPELIMPQLVVRASTAGTR